MRKILLLAAFLASTFIATAESALVKKVAIVGNQRIENQTIVSYLKLKEGEPFNDTLLDLSLKSLYATDFFDDVHLRFDAQTGVLKVSVVENPIINQLVFEGNKRIKDNSLKEVIFLRPRQIYNRSRVQRDLQSLLELYRRMGRYAAVIRPKIIKLPENRVDLVFEIDEGKQTAMRRINFLGNKYFGNGHLGSVIQTKESRWYNFFTTTDRYDPEIVAYDKEKLRQEYYEHGFLDFKVISAVAEYREETNDFFLTFNIEEGERYKINTVELVNELPHLKIESLKALINLKPNSWYSQTRVEQLIDKLEEAIGNLGYGFVEVDPSIKRYPDKPNVIDLVINIKEGPRVYIGEINIEGNIATRDEVIRREFKLAEGDVFNASKIKRSERQVRELGFFKKVEINQEHSHQLDKVDLKVKVEDIPTGEFSIGGGVSSYEGMLGRVRILERNLLGRGQELSASFSLSKRVSEFEVGFIEPYFLGRNLSAGIDVFRTTSNSSRESSYKHHTLGGRITFGYNIIEDLLHQVHYTLLTDRIGSIKEDASLAIHEQKGKAVKSEIGHKLIYNRLDSSIEPRRGYILTLSNAMAGIGGSVHYLRHKATAAQYFPLTQKMTLMIGVEGGMMNKTKKKIRITDRFFIGGDSLRGFDFAGIGPRDKDKEEALGGACYYVVRGEVSFPLGLPNELGVKGVAFFDAGSLWKSSEKTSNSEDKASLRASVGVGIRWRSPFGPLNLFFARPLRKEKFDHTRRFLFSVSTSNFW